MTPPKNGRLVRTVPVRLVDFSWSGCLVAADQPVTPGTTGILRVRLSGRRYEDRVEILRATERQGAADSFDIGGQFTWGRRTGGRSVRSEIPSVVTLP